MMVKHFQISLSNSSLRREQVDREENKIEEFEK